MHEDMIPDSRFISSILEASPDMFFVYDLQSKVYRFVSRGVKEILGYQAKDVLTMKFSFIEQLLHPDDKGKIRNSYRFLKKLNDNDIYHLEYRIRSHSGHYEWLMSRIKIYQRNQQGKPVQIIGITQNIQRFKDLEFYLREKESIQRELLENIDQIFWLESEGKIRYISPAFALVFGMGEEELIRNPFAFLSRVIPEDRRAIIREMKQMKIPENGNHQITFRIRRPDGTIRWIRSRTFVLRDSSNLIRKRGGIAEDITLERENEDRLNKLEKAIECSPASIVITDPYGRIEFVNPAFTRVTGYTEAEVLGKNPRVMKSGHHPIEFYRQLWQQINDGKVWDGEIYNQRKNGQYYWEHTIIAPVKNQDRRITHFVAIKIDVTEEKNMRELANLREEYFRNLFELISFPIIITRIDGTILRVNSAAATLLEADSLLYDKIQVTDFYDDPEDRKRLIDRLKQESRLNGLILKLKSRTGRIVWISLNAELIEYYGEQVILSGLMDITERIKMEKQQKEDQEHLKHYAEELKAINATKDRFFSIIAHDLKNPFTGLLGFTEILINSGDQMPLDKVKNYIALIHESAKNAYTLLENLLDWSRTQTGQIPYHPGPVKLHQLVVEVMELTHQSAQAKTITIINRIPTETLIYADTNMISTVLRNLLTNAIKFTYPEGRIEIFSQENRDMIRISVHDNGIGIPEPQISQMFAIEKNQTRQGTSGEKGTGLGLIVCKEFVERHHGVITIESIPHQGTTISFTLPRFIIGKK